MATVTRALMLYWARSEAQREVPSRVASEEKDTSQGHPLPTFFLSCWVYAPEHTSLTSLGLRPRWVQPRVGWVSYADGEGSFVSLSGEPDWEEKT